MKVTPSQKNALVKRYCNGESVHTLSNETGVARSTLYSWINNQNVVTYKDGFTVSAIEYSHMKQHIQRMEQLIKVLQIADCTTSAPLTNRLYALEKLYSGFPVHVLCDALKVDRGTFYNHIKRNKKGNSSHQRRRDELSVVIKQVFDESKQIFGAKKIKVVLADRNITASVGLIAELMQEMNLYSVRTDAKQVHARKLPKTKKDRLKMDFTANNPNKVWVSDFTYFKFKGRTYYICVIIDLYSRKVISYVISKKRSVQMVSTTFKKAYELRKPSAGLIFHSDRGYQYTAHPFQKLLIDSGTKQSFSPSGSPQHNAVMEGFFSTLKKEELYRKEYHSEYEFRKSIKSYLDFIIMIVHIQHSITKPQPHMKARLMSAKH